MLFATVVGSASSTASTTYLHPDHLGGTNVVTDENGEVLQTLDYFPYGSQRIATGSFDEQRRFIGEEYDGDTEFSYLNARYYQGARGQFMSQDPVFLAVGDSRVVREITQKTLRAILADPQTLNSYSYAGNNPILFKDPTGKMVRRHRSKLYGWTVHRRRRNSAKYSGPSGILFRGRRLRVICWRRYTVQFGQYQRRRS